MNYGAVGITEVCPRDGFQNVKTFIPTEHKIEIIKDLLAAGFRSMEVVSFVSPKWIPQMADAAEVLAEIKKHRAEKGYAAEFIALAPNPRGVRLAAEAGAEAVVYPISVIERHNLDNVNRSREQSFDELSQLIKEHAGLNFYVGLACALGSPYPDEKVDKDDLFRMASRAMEIGAKHIVVADTAGNASPTFVDEVLKDLRKFIDYRLVSFHLHNTLGLSLANTLVALKHGIRTFESAAGGLGGCPFAPGAAGNIATEDLLNMFELMGLKTGLDQSLVLKAVGRIARQVQAPIVGHAYHYQGGH